jgi:hypothetical protein
MKFRLSLPVLSGVLLLPLSLFGKCPIAPNGTLEVRAPAGNLIVEPSGTDSVDVEVNSRQVTVQENCTRDKVTINATADGISNVPDWKIRVPRTVTLDLSTQAGSIRVTDNTDAADALLRTSGGKVTVMGNIKGNALIKGGEVRTGNIGGNVELRGMGGRIQIGDVGGNAEFYSTGGDITAGMIRGSVKAVSGSGSITIRESNGDVVVTTQEGDITSDYIHGAFDGRTESGNIRIERTGSWVHAFTGVGDIMFRLVPEKLGGDLHIKADAGVGNITMYLPEKMKATIDAVIDKPAIGTKKFFSDFPVSAFKAPANALRNLPVPSFIPGGPEKQNLVINGGGNNVKAHTSSGTIRILMGGN